MKHTIESYREINNNILAKLEFMDFWRYLKDFKEYEIVMAICDLWKTRFY